MQGMGSQVVDKELAMDFSSKVDIVILVVTIFDVTEVRNVGLTKAQCAVEARTWVNEAHAYYSRNPNPWDGTALAACMPPRPHR